MKRQHFLKSILIAAALITLPRQAASADDVVDHSSIVTPAELADSEGWYNERLAALTDRSPAAVEPAVHLVRQGWGSLQFGRQVNKNPLKLCGEVYANGLGSHAPEIIEVSLPPGQARCSGLCGVDDTPEAREAKNPVIFRVEVDGREVFKSPPLTAEMKPAAFEIDVAGASKLVLRCDATGDATYTPIDWANLVLIGADGHQQRLGLPPGGARGVDGCFSFRCGDKRSADLLPGWTLHRQQLPGKPDQAADRTAERLSWTDPTSGVECSIDLTRYTKYPVVEWVAHFRNTGKTDSPPIDLVRSADFLLATPDKVILHHNTGDYESDDGYAPHVDDLTPGRAMHFAPTGGRPSDRAWPYFNIEEPALHRGQIVAVGWPGQWAADIDKVEDGGGRLRFSAGQEVLHVRLHPGEEIRTPLTAVMFYRGDVMRSQNLWRRWMIDCNTPRPNGKLPPNILASGLGLWENQTSEIDAIHLFADHKAPLTHWWLDAGWYPCPKDQWWQVGDWRPDPTRYPGGVKAVSDAAHASGLQFILWLEPERSHNGSWMDKNHPEFLLASTSEADNKLFDLGNPAAWRWMVDHIDQLLTSQGVDLYRQDFNIAPLPFWREHDAADRVGMTEMRHVEGHLALWDELLRRHPGMLIDTCASGGRRLDLETLRRSIPLWRSDDSENPEANQSITYGLAEWLPYYGSGVGCDTAYTIRSQMHPFVAFGLPHTTGRAMDWELYHREADNWKTIAPCLSGDYYPMLPYRMDRDSWMAWQFDRPDLGAGVVQAFRRPESAYSAACFRLRGLTADAKYLVTDRDHPGDAKLMTGKALGDTGIPITLDAAPGAALITYRKQ